MLNILIRIIIFLFVPLAHISAEGLVPDDFAQALQLETDGSAAIYEVKLPASVYATVVRRDLGDMRVFNANEERVPHTLRKPRQIQITETRISLPLFPLFDGNGEKSSERADFTIADDGAIVRLNQQYGVIVAGNTQIQKYVIDVSKIDTTIAELEFELLGAGDNYVKSLSIEQSADLNKWRRLVDKATLSRLRFGEHELQFSRIQLPRQQAKYLRFNWDAGADGVQLGSVHAIMKHSNRAEKPLWQTYSGKLSDAEKQVYEFDTGAYYPLEQFNIELGEANTLIEAELSSRPDRESAWRRRHQGLFYTLQVQGKTVQNEIHVLPLVDDRYWQLKLSNSDGLGSIAPRFRIGWAAHSLFFIARGPGPFMLAYGSGKAGPTDKPVDALLNTLNDESRSNFTGTAYISASHQLSGDKARDKHFDISWQRVILSLVLGAGVFLLGFMAFQLLRKINQQ